MVIAGTAKAADSRAIVVCADPPIGRAELKVGDLRVLFDCIDGFKQRADVNPVGHGWRGLFGGLVRHSDLLPMLSATHMSSVRHRVGSNLLDLKIDNCQKRSDRAKK
jgi:hypothetical protein